MKKIITLLLCFFTLTVSAADDGYFSGLTKDQACANSIADGRLKVIWPGAEAYSPIYNIFIQDGQKILVYVVSLGKNGMDYYENGFSNFLYTYNCVTKKTTEITGLQAGGLQYPLYVNTNRGISSIVLSVPPGTRNKSSYTIFTSSFDSQSGKMTWKEKKIDLMSPDALGGYEEAIQSYISLLKKEGNNYKDIMLTSADYLYGGSLENIMDGTVVTFADILQDTNGSKYGFAPEIAFINDEPFLLLQYKMRVHKDGNNKTFNEGTTIPLSMPSMIIPIGNMWSGPDVGNQSPQYTITTEQIKWLYDQGLTKYQDLVGYNPTGNFTREQAAKFFAQLAISVYKQTPDTSKECTFLDESSVDSTLLNDITTSCQLGIFKGVKGKFEPKRAITAAEAVAVLIRIVSGPEDEIGHLWYSNYLIKAKEMKLIPEYGVLYGFENNSPLSRGLIGKMIYKASQK